jgi:CheY-like chemotaxis protein
VITKRNRILLIDDDIDDQVYFRDAINEISPQIFCEIANNGKEALLQMETAPLPELIFLDLNMPIMNGYEFLTSLRRSSHFNNIPVVILTTSRSNLDIEQSKKLGASLFFTKPSNFGLLVNKLKSILNLDFPSTHFIL